MDKPPAPPADALRDAVWWAMQAAADAGLTPTEIETEVESILSDYLEEELE